MTHFWIGKFCRPTMPSTMAMCATGANPLAASPMNSEVLVWDCELVSNDQGFLGRAPCVPVGL